MSGAVSYRVRRQRARAWRRLLWIALLVGALFGCATAAAAAARRTGSAYDRFSAASDAWDAGYINYEEDDTAILAADDLRTIPGVATVDAVRYDFAAIGPGTAYLADATGRLGVEVNRARILEGRWLDADAAGEVVISFALAEREGLRLGDLVELFPLQYLEAVETEEDRAFVDALLEAVPGGQFRVVGVAAVPGQFPPIVDPSVPLMHLSPAFAKLPEASPNGAFLVRFEPGADSATFGAAVRALADEQGKPPYLGFHDDIARDVDRSLRPQVVALLALAAILALVASVVAVQTVARQVDADAADHPTLRAVGMTGAGLRALAVAQWAVVGVLAGLASLLVAWVLSPLSPTGLARIAEPDPGLRIDGWLFALGAVATFVLVVAAGWAFTARVSRRAAGAGRPLVFAGWGTHPVVSLGVRRALDRGNRGGRVPVWSTLAGATVGLAALAASLVVGATLGRQLDDPERYGLRWDLEVSQFTENSVAVEGPDLLYDDDRLTGIAVGLGGSTPIGGRDRSLLAMDPVRGEVRPPLVRGTYPDAPDSVALGGRTLDEFGVDVGGTVELDFSELGGAAHSFRVVGEVLMPPQGTGGRMDEGIFLSLAGIQRAFDADEPILDSLFLAGAPGADLTAVVDDLVERVRPEELPSLERPTTPSDLVDLGRARSMPALFAAAMAVAGAAGLAHTMLVSQRRQRRDTAVLRALGFQDSQLLAVALVQAGVLGVVTAVVGVIAGVVAGRLAWEALADTTGSSLAADVPVLMVGLVLPLAVVAVAGLLSLVSGWRASRLRPAAVLRTE